VYSQGIFSALIDARVQELHRAARPIARPRLAGTIPRWTAALASFVNPVVQPARVAR
jgi:hypothetical protein